ncbi:D-alanyl-D-alanine carboxypeptidase family protein [Gracilibacillus timonensis]|uniref:D-alanyl-D-alanine carboxypeptidase family protein n=1 Tax=Gracilibacillus timonensis TaxID=1816696 RepID=UPI000824F8AF|nr:D-alanyl-D-alanine carboxypeptidase family protein [Gracilibacillus timonensis]
MSVITLHKEDIHKGYQMLVNKQHSIKDNQYFTRQLLPMGGKFNKTLLKKNTGNLLNQLLDTIAAKEKIALVSGYRSQQEQEEIYKSSIVENGQLFTEKYVALPNCSEHQTGMAIDLGERADNIDFIRPHFPYSGIAQILRENAVRYGFLERYQKHKEAVTGISHEPWHFRYVGYPHASIMHHHDLCLEEYIPFIKDYKFGEKHYGFSLDNKKVEVSYIQTEADSMNLDLSDTLCYQISGNNVDGFILTTWR